MTEGGYLVVQVVTRAARAVIDVWEGETLRVRLAAPPIDGRANDSLRRLLADHLQVPVSDIEIVSGAQSRIKRLRIAGLTAGELRRRLGYNATQAPD